MPDALANTENNPENNAWGIPPCDDTDTQDCQFDEEKMNAYLVATYHLLFWSEESWYTYCLFGNVCISLVS